MPSRTHLLCMCYELSVQSKYGRHPTKPYLILLPSRTRGHDTRFRQIQTSFSGYQHSFFPRMIIAGSLPEPAGHAPLHFKPATDVFNLLILPYLLLFVVHGQTPHIAILLSSDGGNYWRWWWRLCLFSEDELLKMMMKTVFILNSYNSGTDKEGIWW